MSDPFVSPRDQAGPDGRKSAEGGNDIDILQVTSFVWRSKFLIALCAVLGIFAAGLFAEFVAVKRYQSSAIFQIESEQSGLQLPAGLSGFASLAGLGGQTGPSENIEDRVNGLDFINAFIDEFDLMADLTFNTEHGSVQDNRPSVFARALSPLGVSAPADPVLPPTQSAIERQSVVESYEELLSLDETANGAFVITVTHEDPSRAAVLANGFVAKLKRDLEAEQKDEQDRSLKYISEQLGDAILAVGEAEKAAQAFAVANNVSSKQQFIARSVELNTARDLRKAAEDRLSALTAITQIYADPSVDRAGAETQLRSDHPIVDDEQFRISLGLPAAINEWRWPNATRVSTLVNVERDKIARQDLIIEELVQKADELAEASIALRNLERDAALAQATYEVLIQQAKAQDLKAGYEFEALRVYQTAIPSSHPSQPNKLILLAMGLVAGIFFGLICAVLWTLWTGRVYSRKALLDLLKPRLTVSGRALKALRGTSYSLLAKRAQDLRSDQLTELPILVNATATKWVMLSSEGVRKDPLGLAIWLAQRSARGGKRNAVFDMTGTVTLPASPSDAPQTEGFERYDDTHLSVFRPSQKKQADALLIDADLLDRWTTMVSPFDRVFVICDRNHVVATARALDRKDPLTILYTASGKPRWNKLTNIANARPIDVVVLEER